MSKTCATCIHFITDPTVEQRVLANRLEKYRPPLAKGGVCAVNDIWTTKNLCRCDGDDYAEIKPAWSARCDCRNDHNSSSGRCNRRNVFDPTRTDADGFAACEDCRENCPCGSGKVVQA